MNMKRIVFAAIGILIMLVILAFTLHSMSHVDEINQKRRDKERGEAIASKMIDSTTVTTSVWDRIRQTETETVSENPEESGETQESGLSEEETAVFPDEENSTEAPQTEIVFPDTLSE